MSSSQTVALTVNVPIADLSPEAIERAIIDAAVNRVLGIAPRATYDEGGEYTGDVPDTRALDRMRAAVAEAIGQRTKAMVEERVPAVIDEALGATFQPMTAWGEPAGKETTLRAMVYEYAKSYCETRVRADNGEPDPHNYHGGGKTNRLHWIIRKQVDEYVTTGLRDELKSVADEIKPALRERLSAAVSETVNRLLGVAK